MNKKVDETIATVMINDKKSTILDLEKIRVMTSGDIITFVN